MAVSLFDSAILCVVAFPNKETNNPVYDVWTISSFKKQSHVAIDFNSYHNPEIVLILGGGRCRWVGAGMGVIVNII